MSAVAETDAPHLNLRVKGTGSGFLFGSYPHGKLIPKWVAEQSGRTAEELVAAGIMEWSTEVVTDDFRAPAPRADERDDATEAMAEELDRLRRQVVALKDQNKTLTGQNASLAATNALHLKTLGEQTAEIARLKVLADGLALKAKQLTEDLDAATAPVSPRAAALLDPKAAEIVAAQSKAPPAFKGAPNVGSPTNLTVAGS